MTPAEHAARVERIRAERAAIGRGPYIESEAPYLLLSAIAEVNRTAPSSVD